MRFFKPKKKFLTWIKRVMKSHPKQPLVDCGAGDGDLVWELNQLQLPALGLDPMWDGGKLDSTSKSITLASRMMSGLAEESTFVTKLPAVLICCRPCHSAFPARINRARHPESVFYYIGFAKNLMWDLAGAPVKLVMTGAGEEGECLWEVGDPDAREVSAEMKDLLNLVGL